MRSFCVEVGNGGAQIFACLFFELHDVAQAVIEGNVGQEDIQQLSVDAAAVGFDDLEEREANIVKERLAFLVEFLVGKFFQMLDTIDKLLADARVRDQSLGLHRGGV